MNRALLDQGLAPKAAALLRSQGWDAIHVSEAGLERADDPAILEFARQRGMTCVTLDHDFHAHLALGLNAQGQAELIIAVWEVCGEAIAEGAAVSTDGVAVRLHRLPLK